MEWMRGKLGIYLAAATDGRRAAARVARRRRPKVLEEP
jgi:hypothetical protein